MRTSRLALPVRRHPNPRHQRRRHSALQLETLEPRRVLASTIALGATDFNVSEGVGTVDIDVLRTGDLSEQATLDYTTVDGSAVAGEDYTANAGTLVFAPNESVRTISVAITDDAIGESNEVFSLAADAVGGSATLAFPRTAQITLVDNDPVFVFGLRGEYFHDTSLSNLALVRTDPQVNFDWGGGSPDSSMAADNFSVRWSGLIFPEHSELYTFRTVSSDGVRLWIAGQLVIDQWQPQSTTAHAGQIQLQAGLNYSITVEYFEQSGDALAKLEWSSPSQPWELVPQSQLATGPPQPPSVEFLSTATQIDESGASATLTVVRNGPTTDAASIDYQSNDGTATAGADYGVVSGTLSFAAGQSTANITVTAVDDNLAEFNETFFVKLSNPAGINLGTQDFHQVTIADDDSGEFVQETAVSGLVQPIAMDWAPDGSLFIAEQRGVVRLVQNGALLPTPFIDYTTEVNGVRDRGLLGLAVHPSFPAVPYVYLLYTYDPPETQGAEGLAAPDQKGNRVARLTRVSADPSTNFQTALPGSDVVLLGKNSVWANISHPELNSTVDISLPPSCQGVSDCIPADSESHTIGDVRFGTDGMLYVSSGDGTSYGRVDPRTTRVQDLDSLSGKILRIDPLTGQGLSDNPFYNGDPLSDRSKVYSYGLRNPFRFAVDPNTNEPYIGDVGWTAWEEINSGRGANFGWPYYEGGDGVSLQTGGYSSLPEAQAFYDSQQPVAAPLLGLSHADGAVAVVMGDFYTGSAFPSVYQNALFYTDVGAGYLDALIFDDSGNIQETRRLASEIGGIVQIKEGPDGNLYFAMLFTGEIVRFRPVQPQSTVVETGTVATIYGSPGNDSIVYTMGNGQVDINGSTFNISAGITQVNISAGTGDDALILTGGSGPTSVMLHPTMGDIISHGIDVHIEEMETMTIHNGGAPGGAAVLYDSTGADTFRGEPTTAKMFGNGFTNIVNGFPEVLGMSAAGGSDVAILFDSAGDDRFSGQDTTSTLSGPGFNLTAQDFGRVVAHATAGGSDIATLFGSNGDDRLLARPDMGRLYGTGFDNVARSFDRVYSYGTAGGDDWATFRDSPGDDTLTLEPAFGRFTGTGFWHVARDFERYFAFGSAGGEDRAYLEGSAGDDVLVADPTLARFSGTSFLFVIRDFDRVVTRSTTGGNDTAELSGSTGDDRYFGRQDFGQLTGPGFYNRVEGFASVIANSTLGGDDRLNIDALDYLFTAQGNWT